MSEPQSKRSKAPLIVGGVPEHFNFPWRMAKERGLFQKYGAQVEFREEKLGTGAMIANAKSGEFDLIIALTEGLVADIARGSDLRLLGTYVNSPLCWAISTGNKSNIATVEDLRAGKFGVSRLGSGSQLMAYVLAIERGWNTDEISFDIKGDIHQLCKGVDDLSTDAFLWETFTTKPYHDAGVVRRIGEITTPWPCFMVAAKKSLIDERFEEVQACLAAVHEAASLFKSEAATMPALIASNYGLKLEDARAWYSQVTISAHRFISEAALDKAVRALKTCKQLDADRTYDVSSFLDTRIAEMQSDLRTMKLYDRSELVIAARRQIDAAFKDRKPKHYTDLLPYDQHHYYGTDAVDDVIKLCNITSDSCVINIGSGLGGPARYISGRTGCMVTACELQRDVSRMAIELTEMCGMQQRIVHMLGDFMDVSKHLPQGKTHAIVSWLTVLHFANRIDLFRRCHSLLTIGGYFFAADFYARGKLTNGEKKTLREDVGCETLAASVEDYKRELELAGFRVVTMTDTSDKWATYTSERAKDFESKREEFGAIMGQDVFEHLLKFYQTVASLYAGGRLGGLEVLAQRPLGW